MEYFSVLNLNREPFSNSPDPEFFFESRKHIGCLQQIELSVRLKKGLVVIFGDVGTGKTTLCRQLIRRFGADEQIETHLILDPDFSSPTELLSLVAASFWKIKIKKGVSDWQLKEAIKRYLFRRGVSENKNVVLIIDEGQKLPEHCLETLREFLNYETNKHKLLQIIVFAQNEFEQVLQEHRNFSDRVSLYYSLRPLGFRDTRAMIRFRIQKAGGYDAAVPVLFSHSALWVIYRESGGYPRRIINLCHRILLALIIQNRSRAGWRTARTCAKRFLPRKTRKPAWGRLGALAGILGILILLALNPWRVQTLFSETGSRQEAERSPGVSQRQRFFIAKTSGKESPLREPGGEPKATKMAQVSGPPPRGAEKGDSPKETLNPSHRSADQGNAVPDTLGQLALGEKETIGEMIQKIYGIFNNQYLRSVMEANREMTDPNLIRPGTVVRFPAISLGVDPPPRELWWLQVGRKDTLSEAYQFLKSYPAEPSSIRLIPCWTKREGLKFHMIQKTGFKNEQSARRQLERLPAHLISNATVFNVWAEGSVFFANPVS